MDWVQEIWNILQFTLIFAVSVGLIKFFVLDTITEQIKEQTILLELISNSLSDISSDIISIETNISSLESNISRIYPNDDD